MLFIFMAILAAIPIGLPTFVLAAENPENAAIIVEIHKDYPNIKVEKVSKTDLDGIYEVVAEGNIFYYHQKSGSIITGEIIRKGRSVTQARKEELQAQIVKELPLNKAIKIGSGKNTVIEFSDPDCPFCRRADTFLKSRKDVSLYLFLFPLPNHRDAYKKSLRVLCAADNPAAYREITEGKLDGPFTLADNCEKKKAPLLSEHMAWGKKLGVAGTPAFWINGVHVEGADMDRISGLLTQGPAVSSK